MRSTSLQQSKELSKLGDLVPILAITKNTTIDAAICEHLNDTIIETYVPHAKKYGKRDNVKVSVIASALQTIGLKTGVLQVEPDHQHQNFQAIHDGTHVVVSHGPAKGFADNDRGCPALPRGGGGGSRNLE